MMDGGFFLGRCGVGSDLFFAGLGNLQLDKTIHFLDPVCMIACAFGDPLISIILGIGGFHAFPWRSARLYSRYDFLQGC